MSRTKVMWFIKGLGAGGAERLLTASIPYIDRNRFNYEVAFCVASQNDLVPEFKNADIPIFCLDLKTPYDPRVLYRLFRLLRDRKPQILHLHLPYTGILGRVIGHLAGVKGIVYTEHSVMEVYHPLTRLLNLITYPFCRVNIAVSKEVQRSIMKHRIARQTKTIVIRNGVNPDYRRINGERPDKTREALGIPANHKVVGNVAHIRPEKGHFFLLQAAKIVLDKWPDVTFVVVGSDNTNGKTSSLKDMAKRLGIQNHVIFTGFRQDVFDIMRIFDLFVLPSLNEGLSLALLEAMSMGKPVIASHVGGIPEVIKSGLNGFLVPPKNPEALAERILELLRNEKMGKQMGQNGMQNVRDKFNIQQSVRRIEQVYTLTVNGN